MRIKMLSWLASLCLLTGGLMLFQASPTQAGVLKKAKKAGKKVKKGSKGAGNKLTKSSRSVSKHIKSWSRTSYKKFISKVKSLTRSLARKKRSSIKSRVIRYMRSKRTTVSNKIRGKLRSQTVKYRRYKTAYKANKRLEMARIKSSLRRPPNPGTRSRVLQNYLKRKIPSVIISTAVAHVALSSVYWGIYCIDKGYTGSRHRSCFEKNFLKDMTAARWAYEIALAIALLPLENAVFRPMCISSTANIIAAASAAVGNPAPAGASPIVYELCVFAFTTATAMGLAEATWNPYLRYVWRPLSRDIARSF